MSCSTNVARTLALLVILLCSLIAFASEKESVDLGHSKFACTECHDGSDPSAMSSENARSCLSCHESESGVMVEAGRSHPVDVAYTFAPGQSLRDPDVTPSGLGGTVREDLLHDGRIVCLSCHDPHGEDDGLLVMNETKLCMACHQL